MKLQPLHIATPCPALKVQPPGRATVPSYAPIVSAVLEGIEGLSTKHHLETGTTLLLQGSSSQSVSLIRAGVIKLTCKDGAKGISCLGLRSSGWWCGAVSVYLDLPSEYSAVTLSPCVVSQLAPEEFLTRIADDAQLMRSFISALCGELLTLSEAQAQLLSATASQRLDRFMHERKNTTPPWSVMDPLPVLKQVELAQLMAISPEHLSRLLRRRRDEATTHHRHSDRLHAAAQRRY